MTQYLHVVGCAVIRRSNPLDEFDSIPDPYSDGEPYDTPDEPFLVNEDLLQEYVQAVQAGDEKRAGQVQWRIAIANQKLIWWFARNLWRKWRPGCLSVQDLAHHGLFGMLRAVEKYRSSFETKLSTYAGWWIRRYIESSIFENGSTIRIPEYRIAQKAQIDAAMLDLLEDGKEPTRERIAAELNRREAARFASKPKRNLFVWTPAYVDEVNQSTVKYLSSMDGPVYGPGSDDLHAMIAAEPAAAGDEGADPNPFLRTAFQKILDSSGLTGRNRLMLELFFYGESRNKAEVARLFGVHKDDVGSVLERFEETCGGVFKRALSGSSFFMEVFKFSLVPEKTRNRLADAVRGANDSVRRAARERFGKDYPEICTTVRRDQELLQEILEFCTWPRQHRGMLAVYFCGDDLSKHDVGVLCGVSRERVRQVIEQFTHDHRGPLTRLFLREFISPREACERFVAARYEPHAARLEQYLKHRGLEQSAGMLKHLFIERLPRTEIAKRAGNIPLGTVTNRLKRAAEKIGEIPTDLAPLLCGGSTWLTPKEIFARQLWDLLPRQATQQYCDGLSQEEHMIFCSRLSLDGQYPTLKQLAARTGKRNASEVSSLLDRLVHEFIDFAGEFLSGRH